MKPKHTYGGSRALPLMLALLFCLPSCAALDSFAEMHETSVYIPIESQVTDPLFSWENEDPEPEPEPAEPDAPEEASPAEELPFDPVPTAEIPSPSPGEVEVKPPEEQEEPEEPEAEAEPEGPSRAVGSTPWTSLTAGEDEAREGLFTRAETALVAEQIVRCCVNRTWLSAEVLTTRGFDADSVSNFYFSSLKYAAAEDYPEALCGIVAWDENEAKYAVTEKGADIASRFFPGDHRTTETDDRYTVDEDGYPVSKYDLTDLEILSDEISTVARFRLISYEGKEPEDCGEYRLFFYQNKGTGKESNPIPRMLFAKKEAAEDADADLLPLRDWVYEKPIPDFLNEEQADLWRQALMLEGLESDPVYFLESFPRKDGEPFLSGEYYPVLSTVDENGTAWDWTLVRGRFENYYDFERAVTSVYTWGAWEDRKINFKNFDGKLRVANGAMGSRVGHMPEYDRFEIITSNEWTLDFWYIAAYEHELGTEDGPIDYERWHVTYVSTDSGWRLSEFASGTWGGASGENRITAHRISDDGAKLLTEQIVRYVMPQSWTEGEVAFGNDDALRFLYSLSLFVDREDHPYSPYVRLMEDRERFEIREEDARMIVKEVFGIDDLVIPDGAFDEVAGCVWIPVGIELPTTGYDCEDFHVLSDGMSRTAMFYLTDEDGMVGTYLFTYAPGVFGKPMLSAERAG
ncbi:MAG: hypothetical protein K6G29_06385 [Clostridiales bacterium]|nr:hypothetical protein [Clostridiales bacterium]